MQTGWGFDLRRAISDHNVALSSQFLAWRERISNIRFIFLILRNLVATGMGLFSLAKERVVTSGSRMVLKVGQKGATPNEEGVAEHNVMFVGTNKRTIGE